jgi:MoaA/NifB/PqqE/SkfB family radical SAM enzyme
MPKCILPWISIEATPMGTTRPCCLAKHEIPGIDLKKHTLEDAFRSEYMDNMRRAFSQGTKPGQCESCWIEEDAGKKSKREYMLEKFRHIEVDYNNTKGESLQFLDLKLGNICNLKCRICGTWSSSKWGQEELDYYNPDLKGNSQIKDWLKAGQWPRTSRKFWEQVDELLPQIKYFEFTGGEPFLIKQHFDLLERAVKKGYAKNIDVHYNTNTTKFPKQYELWKHFKHVQIAFSVDNTEERFEYERYGAKWRTCNKTIDSIHELRDSGEYRMETQLCATWNIQNIYYLDDVLAWADTKNFNSIHFNLMHDPWEMAISNIPKNARAELMLYLQKCQVKHEKYAQDIDSLKKIIMKSKQADAQDLHNKLRRTDLYRNQNFAKSHSKMAKAIGYEL